MKTYVFIHCESIPEGRVFSELTDAEIMDIAEHDGNYVSHYYNSFEEFIADFNCECCPDASFYYGRAIEIEDQPSE